MRTIRVLLVDDSVEFMDSAIGFLSRDPRVSVVGQAQNGWDGVRLAKQLKPDLVLMDVVLPEMNGLVATRLIKTSIAAPRVVIVTMHEDAEYRRSAEEASADGFLCKSQFGSAMPALIDSFFSGAGRRDDVGETQ